MLIASILAPVIALAQPVAAAAAPAPVCQGAPGRPALCRPAAAVQPAAAAPADRVAMVACHPDPSRNRGCFRPVHQKSNAALAQAAPVREDAR